MLFDEYLNSLLMAHQFISMLPAGEAPQYTEGREGYYWVKEMTGNSAKTVLKLDIRDFSQQCYRDRMAFLQNLADSCETFWGESTISIQLDNRYKNVANSLEGEARFPIDIAKEAYKRNNITMNAIPMRGGYDARCCHKKAYLALTFSRGHITSILFMNTCRLHRCSQPALL